MLVRPFAIRGEEEITRLKETYVHHDAMDDTQHHQANICVVGVTCSQWDEKCRANCEQA